jgi:hypothetical protein
MNAILKFIAGMCIVTSLAMSGCIDSVTVDQNGTVTIDPANAATANGRRPEKLRRGSCTKTTNQCARTSDTKFVTEK